MHEQRTCAWCAGPLPEGSTARRMFCKDKCRDAARHASVAYRLADLARDQRPERIAQRSKSGRSLRERRKAQGLCERCGHPNPNAPDTATCDNCSHGPWRAMHRIARGH